MKKSIAKWFSFVNLFIFTLKYPKENFIIYWNITYLQSTFRISVSAWLVPQYCHFYKRTSVIHVISELDYRNRVLCFISLFLQQFAPMGNATFFILLIFSLSSLISKIILLDQMISNVPFKSYYVSVMGICIRSL